MTSITIVLASNCSYFINKIHLLAKQCDDIRLISETRVISSVPQLIAALQPDILLLKVSVFDSNVIDTLREIHSRNPSTKILLSSAWFSDESINKALVLGARGFLLDSCSSYIKAIRTVHAGDIWLSRKLLVSLLENLLPVLECQPEPSPSDLMQSLTSRERQIAVQVIDGLTNKEIARQLRISDKTVKVHLEHIFNKLHINRRTQLFHYLGLVSPNTFVM